MLSNAPSPIKHTGGSPTPTRQQREHLVASVDQDGRLKPPGRIRSALAVLFGRSVTPQQIQQEWLEWEITLGSVLDRFSALLARQAKAEKKRVELELTNSEETASPHNAHIATTGWSRKAELYTRAASAKGLGAYTKNGGIDP
jgi:hypothetical protein